jgi:bifunctional non-homologous end joining protein LigD
MHGSAVDDTMPRSFKEIPAPLFVEPMAARDAAALPEEEGWIYEIKFDGYRGLGIKHGGSTRLLSRNNKNLGSDFPELLAALRTIKADTALLDGEIVALDQSGKPSFQLLQNRRTGKGPIVFYVFDLLSLNGVDWRSRPLVDRKRKLARILEGSDIKLSASLSGAPARIVAAVRELGLEGVIAKRSDSLYQSGERSGAWLKLKLSPEQEFVVGGYRRGTPLEALIVGYYEGRELVAAGQVRAGLNAFNRRSLQALLEPLHADNCPFSNLPNSRKSHWGEGITAAQMHAIQWVKPSTVAQIAFTEWTAAGGLRHPAFKGIRTDKKPRDVVKEQP